MIDWRSAVAAQEPELSAVYVGVMSGTSLDGITCAVVRFTLAPDSDVSEPSVIVEHRLIGHTVKPYTAAQRARLLRALSGATPEEYCRLNFDLGAWIADAVCDAIAEAGIARADILAVASHGQTVWHVPGHSTWQIGEAAVIAERTGIDVVSDFRVRDIAAGGEGAPLVSMADAMLYAAPTEWRLLQNIGGIGNVSIVPPGGDVAGVRAFDTGPGVGVLDHVVRTLYPELAYDVDGAIATRGTPIREVVQTLLDDPYFAQHPPKSTGREKFSPAYAARVIEMARNAGAKDPADIVATAALLTAASIADAYRRFIPVSVGDVLVSGGGAKHPGIMAFLRQELPGMRIRSFEDEFYDGEAKEAVAFALLGLLNMEASPGNVIGATGARGPRVLGKLTPA